MCHHVSIFRWLPYQPKAINERTAPSMSTPRKMKPEVTYKHHVALGFACNNTDPNNTTMSFPQFIIWRQKTKGKHDSCYNAGRRDGPLNAILVQSLYLYLALSSPSNATNRHFAITLKTRAKLVSSRAKKRPVEQHNINAVALLQ